MAAQPPQLVAIGEGASILLDKPILLIGRHQECDIQIPSRKISRRHCCIAQVDDYLVVRDLCSTNGIRINGERVHEGQLKSGDELTIGNFRYQVEWSDAAEVPPSANQAVQPPGEQAFDSCEEPIALAEPGGPPHRPVPRTNLEQPPRGLAFSEDLDLAPRSDSQLK